MVLIKIPGISCNKKCICYAFYTKGNRKNRKKEQRGKEGAGEMAQSEGNGKKQKGKE